MQIIQDLQKGVQDWADTLIPDRTASGAVAKLMLEEIPELLVALSTTGKIDKGEIADVLILALDICALEGIDAGAAIVDKMNINRNRDWELNDRGMLSHVSSSSA